MGESLMGEIFWGRSGIPFPRLTTKITFVLSDYPLSCH